MSTEIQDRAGFSHVRYAMCWEDADILIQALRCHQRPRCLSIGSAGDNSFALLAAGAHSVAVAEMNPAQIACIEARRAAYLRLDHAGLLALLGLRPCADRAALFRTITPELTPAAHDFWERRPNDIASGMAQAGKFENYFRLFRRWVLPLAHGGRRVESLLQQRPFEERLRFYETEWNNRRWRTLFRMFFSRFVMGRLGRDPEFFRYVQGSVADRLLERARHALVVLDPSQNPYLHFILTGNFRQALPLSLRPESFEPIRSALREDGRFSIHHGTVESLLSRTSARPFDAFNLSDIFEYMSPENSEALLRSIVAAAAPQARLAYWNMLAQRSRPEALASVLAPVEDEAARLFAQDKAFFYSRFIIESVLA